MLEIAASLILSLGTANAAAPARPGQPYAEPRCGADPNILLCEDFDYEQNFFCAPMTSGSGYQWRWNNPGLSNDGQLRSFEWCAGADWPPASQFPPAPGVGGRVFRARPGVDAGGSNMFGAILGDADRTTGDKPMAYKNGAPATNDLYFRFQMYNAPDWHWPEVADNKVLYFFPNRRTGNTESNVDAGLFFAATGIACADLNRGFGDGLAVRIGSNSGNFKTYPADVNTNGYPEHQEYCLGAGRPDRQFGDQTVAIETADEPVGDPNPGTAFRMRRGRWYTVELRYKLSDPGASNGIVELWIDGTKVYSDNDLETCGAWGPSEGDCYALHDFILHGSWYNVFWGGDYQKAEAIASYRLIDNFIISKTYIGPPGAPVADARAPARPRGLAAR